jgi:hypothetical protein
MYMTPTNEKPTVALIENSASYWWDFIQSFEQNGATLIGQARDVESAQTLIQQLPELQPAGIFVGDLDMKGVLLAQMVGQIQQIYETGITVAVSDVADNSLVGADILVTYHNAFEKMGSIINEMKGRG